MYDHVMVHNFTFLSREIIDVLPATVSQVRNIRFFTRRNFISYKIPASHSQVRRLRTLDLSYNQLKSNSFTVSHSLRRLSNSQKYLKYNNITCMCHSPVYAIQICM